jgi:predicted Zn-dependent peptidase
MVTREVLDTGLRLITETMPHVRSVSIGVWLTRGSRHESEPRSGIAHFVEHMLFKGTPTRSAEDIAQEIDSIGGQLDAFTAKEYASYYIKVLDEHLPLAVDLLSDIVMHPRFEADDLDKEKKVILEEIKMVEDTPDDLVHELFTQHFWEGHALGRPILGSKETVESFTPAILRDYFGTTYVAPNLIVSAAGNIQHAQVRDLISRAFGALPRAASVYDDNVPVVVPQVMVRTKELEPTATRRTIRIVTSATS